MSNLSKTEEELYIDLGEHEVDDGEDFAGMSDYDQTCPTNYEDDEVDEEYDCWPCSICNDDYEEDELD